MSEVFVMTDDNDTFCGVFKTADVAVDSIKLSYSNTPHRIVVEEGVALTRVILRLNNRVDQTFRIQLAQVFDKPDHI